jgi:uncharacterized protein YgbK (DUF1537 family)
MTNPLILGVVADDFTGATDVAGMLVREGLRVVQVIGVPQGPVPEADAIVVALKSRTAPPQQAVAESLAAWRWLKQAGARQCYFKVCSTFDSTPQGNIGPVAEALMAALDTPLAIACPAFPENGRTVFRGHLFVGDALLSDTGMRHHPLTPMTDANLVRVLQAQSASKVGLLRHDVLGRGAGAVRERLAALQQDGVKLVIGDAIDDEHLRVLAEVVADHALVVAGSGVALGLPAAYARRGWVRPQPAQAAAWAPLDAPAAVLSGSCSVATNAQVQHWLDAGRPARRIDALALADGEPQAAQALAWAREQMAAGQPMLVYATSAPAEVAQVQQRLGAERAGQLVEHALATVAAGLAEAGVQRFVVAGGETSGAVVQALQVQALRIGATIDPGVPWTRAEGRPLWLALKSGNFGTVDFFSKSLDVQPR